jgi:hypothetical protein
MYIFSHDIYIYKQQQKLFLKHNHSFCNYNSLLIFPKTQHNHSFRLDNLFSNMLKLGLQNFPSTPRSGTQIIADRFINFWPRVPTFQCTEIYNEM